MRCPLCHVLIALTLLCNMLLLYYTWHLNSRPLGRLSPAPTLTPGITVLVREFRSFEHGLAELRRSFLHARPSLRLLVAADAPPYPPVTGIKLLRLSPSPEQPGSAFRLDSHIHTRLVALVPDGTSLDPPDLLDRMARALRDASSAVRIVAAGAGAAPLCLHLNVSLRVWTAEYRTAAGEICGAISGLAVLMMRSRDLFDLPFPLSRPLQAAIFMQAALRGWGVKILRDAVFPRSPVPATDHGRWKAEQAERAEEAATMRAMGIRLVRGPQGGEERWYGCSKETRRCFGTVLGETPEYLYEGRWAPPCCLRALRSTLHHVVKVLEACNVRYWLEGGSLLGAARHGDIIPWDYDVDLGLYLEDVELCAELRGARGGSLVDSEGFVWERAVEGDFFRVQYSQTNHLHVDLWPFYPQDGLMTRDSWTGHPQDIKFPESFLQPLQTLSFAGALVQVPNSHVELLKLKFGEKAIEQPQYPNPALLRMR